MSRVDVDEFRKRFEKLMPKIRQSVYESSRGIKSDQNYKIIWDHFQRMAINHIADIIRKEFPFTRVTVSESKSTYPDIEIICSDCKFAVDIKSNESGKEPWYDIARLDTIHKARLNKYMEEYDMLIRYERGTGRVEAVFFEPMYRTVGKDSRSGGVKYRPYDGKLRPKSWEMFENGEAFWNSKEEFLAGVAKSMHDRRRRYIEEWFDELPEEEKVKLRRRICAPTLEGFR